MGGYKRQYCAMHIHSGGTWRLKNTVVVWAAAAAWLSSDAHRFHAGLQYGFVDGSLGASELSPAAASVIQIEGLPFFSKAVNHDEQALEAGFGVQSIAHCNPRHCNGCSVDQLGIKRGWPSFQQG